MKLWNFYTYECDGERYHSSEAQIRGDMERQTILERLGWRFIRIRGSEYYRDPEKTIERVVAELQEYEIEPEEIEIVSVDRDTELLRRVKARAAAIMLGEDKVQTQSAAEIMMGLNPKEILELQAPETKRVLTETLPMILTDSEPVPEEWNELEETEKFVEEADDHTEIEAELKVSLEIEKDEPETCSPVQMTLNDLVADRNEPSSVIKLLENSGIVCVDKRAKGGAFWIIGGRELNSIVEQCKAYGVTFVFKKGGGKATKDQDGWWAKF